MKTVVLSCGSILVKDGSTEMLFGAPDGVKAHLEQQGLGVPDIVMLTSMRAPGFGRLGKSVLSYKEQPLRINNLSAKPIQRTHGTDYEITSGGARVLFSERGDVSAEETKGYDLAIIKNKHRADAFTDCVITWPWPDREYDVENHHAAIISEKELSKVSKEQVNYRVATVPAQNCGACVHYQQGTCEVVEGEIDPDHVSDLFEASTNTAQDLFSNIGGDVGYKEMTPSGPVVRLGDVISAAMHDAFNSVANTWLRDGLISEEERKNVGQAFGPIVEAFRENAPEYILNRSLLSTDGEMPIPILKEITVDGPVRRFGDVLVAALHTAYNDASDKWYSLGYMNETERKAVGQAIGDALNALRASAPPEIMSRQLVGDDFLFLPKEIKELSSELPEKVSSNWATVFKDKEGNWRWASVTTVVALDDHIEAVTPKAIKWALKFNEIVGTKGPLRFRHIPGLDGGDCTHQAPVGDYLFEAGTFRDNSIGLAMRTLLQNDTGWKMSPGLLYAPKDLLHGVFFKRFLIFERSMTKIPANRFTAILATKGDDMTLQVLSQEQLKEAAEQLELPVDQVTQLYEAARSAEAPLSSVKEFVTLVEKEIAAVTKDKMPPKGADGKFLPRKKKATDRTDDDDDDDDDDGTYPKKTTKEELDAALATLNVEELKELDAAVDAALVGATSSGGLRAEIASLKEAVSATNAQVNALVAAMSGEGSAQSGEDKIAKALRQVLQGAPRATFVSSRKSADGDEGGVDDASVATTLKEIKEQLKELTVPQSEFKSLFTSQTLNRHRNNRRASER